MERHFTVSGFLVDGGRTALHWHRKSQLWLPPGGHVEPNEDPVQAVIREVREETGVTAEIVVNTAAFAGFDEPAQLPPPRTIFIEDIPEAPDREAPHGAHQHIDMIYFLRPAAGSGVLHEPFVWVSERELRENHPLPVAACGVDLPVPGDVRVMGLAAMAAVRAAGA